jgi:hypothetical protein
MNLRLGKGGSRCNCKRETSTFGWFSPGECSSSSSFPCISPALGSCSSSGPTAILSLILARLAKSFGIFYSCCRHEKYVEINLLVLCGAKRMSPYSCLAGQSFLHWSGAYQSIDALCFVSYSGSMQGPCSDSKISLWTPPSLLKVLPHCLWDSN